MCRFGTSQPNPKPQVQAQTSIENHNNPAVLPHRNLHTCLLLGLALLVASSVPCVHIGLQNQCPDQDGILCQAPVLACSADHLPCDGLFWATRNVSCQPRWTPKDDIDVGFCYFSRCI